MLSIIIPAKNEERYIGKLLDSIKKQSFKDYEVIVADNNSIDKTRAIAKRYNAKVISGGWKGPGEARNAGAKIAKGKDILFLDADVILKKKFILENYNEFMERNLDIATTYVKPLSNRIFDKMVHGHYWNLFYFLMQKINPHAAGFCIFVKKDVFRKMNGFDKTITLAEDHEFVQRCCKNNYRFGILHGPRIIVSVRRLDKEGRLRFLIKMLHAFLYRTFVGEIRKNKIRYEFGHSS